MLESVFYLRDSTNMTSDPFSDILKLANAQSVMSGGFTAGGSWAIRFPAFDKLKFSALIRGSCWLLIEGVQGPVRVEAGDVTLLSVQRSFVLASDLAAIPIEASSVFSPHVSEVVNLGGGEECLQIGGFVRLDPASGGLLADVLPPLIHVRAASPHAPVLRWLLDQLVNERFLEPVSRRRNSLSSSSFKSCVRTWKFPASWRLVGCARSLTVASLQLCA
jgi:Cupin